MENDKSKDYHLRVCTELSSALGISEKRGGAILPEEGHDLIRSLGDSLQLFEAGRWWVGVSCEFEPLTHGTCTPFRWGVRIELIVGQSAGVGQVPGMGHILHTHWN